MTDEIFLCKEKTVKDEYLNDIITLEKESVTADVYDVKSAEFFRAKQIGLSSSLMVAIFYLDYNGEKIVEYNGVLYDVYRTYFNEKREQTELYLSERVICDDNNK